MKLRYKRKKDGSESINFHAETKRERVALRDAILASARAPEGLSIEGVARELENAGYGVVETPKKENPHG